MPHYSTPLLSEMEAFKLVAVGDGAVGKTCLLMSFTHGIFPTEYVPTIFDNFTQTLNHNGRVFRLDLYDTAGQEDYDRLRSACYSGTDVFIVCYSCDSAKSCNNIEHKWMPELRRYAPNAKILLVGLKNDLRTSHSEVSYEVCQRLKRIIGADRLLECSALMGQGVSEVFQAAADLAATEQKNACCCTIL